MKQDSENLNQDERYAYLSHTLNQPCPQAAILLAQQIEKKHPGAAVLLYGSGISVMKNAAAKDVLYDFYVIAPSYKQAFKSRTMALLNYLLPPNVFYIEHMSDDIDNSSGGAKPEMPQKLRAKYAVLSIAHMEKLVSKKTFHSYFWGRFAQPMRIVHADNKMRDRVIKCVQSAIDVFIGRSHPLLYLEDKQTEEVPPNMSPKHVLDIWKAGLGRSYKAELRAEAPDRVDKLLEQYEDWPIRVTRKESDVAVLRKRAKSSDIAWRVRVFQGGVLSVLRLLKGTFTFEGGVDYIIWKVSRHAGFSVPVRDWERRWPLIGAPVLARRYYKMKKAHKSGDNIHEKLEDNESKNNE